MTTPDYPLPRPRATRLLRSTARILFPLAVLLLLAFPAGALERGSYSIEILVDDRPLNELISADTTYVEAIEQREYSIRLTNRTGRRIKNTKHRPTDQRCSMPVHSGTPPIQIPLRQLSRTQRVGTISQQRAFPQQFDELDPGLFEVSLEIPQVLHGLDDTKSREVSRLPC